MNSSDNSSIGFDLSLSNTGIATICGDVHTTRSVPSSKIGDSNEDEISRIKTIIKSIEVTIESMNPKASIAVIEGLAFGLQKTVSIMQLAALNYMVRMKLYDRFIPFIIVAPTTLKKFILGKGNGDKDLIMLEVFKKWGVSCTNNDEADAFVLAKIGEAILDSENSIPKINLLSYQKEVLKTLQPQIKYVK